MLPLTTNATWLVRILGTFIYLGLCRFLLGVDFLKYFELAMVVGTAMTTILLIQDILDYHDAPLVDCTLSELRRDRAFYLLSAFVLTVVDAGILATNKLVDTSVITFVFLTFAGICYSLLQFRRNDAFVKEEERSSSERSQTSVLLTVANHEVID
jgi:hypothetical protein